MTQEEIFKKITDVIVSKLEVKAEDVKEIVAEHLVKGRVVQRLCYDPEQAKKLVAEANIPFYQKQYRIVLRNCGVIDPEKIEDYIARDGYKAIEKVLFEMSDYSSLEHNLLIKLCPLFLKDFGMMRMAYMRNRGITSSISNLGRIEMPEDIGAHISKFAAFMACKTVFVCISTFEDRMVFGITSSFKKHMLALNFFRKLAEMGVRAELAGNDYNMEEDTDADLSEVQDNNKGK